VNNYKIDFVNTFKYSGSIMDEKGGTDANRSRAAFASLKPLWRSNIISLKTPGGGYFQKN